MCIRDRYKINILGERIGMGDSMMMKDIHCWCTRQNIRSVSYTHLIIKKQASKIVEFARRTLFLTDSETNWRACIWYMAVSYTHLDVYKRQIP